MNEMDSHNNTLLAVVELTKKIRPLRCLVSGNIFSPQRRDRHPFRAEWLRENHVIVVYTRPGPAVGGNGFRGWI